MSEPDLTTETRTDAEELIVAMLCRWSDGNITGPNAWLCRLAWVTFLAEQPFDVDAVIAERLDWLDAPGNVRKRADLVDCVEFLHKVATKQSRWPLPAVAAFDPSTWMEPTQ